MIIEREGKRIKLPDFLIVGAAKSGTTSLYYYLKQHPQIFLPEIKEPWFFSFMDSPPSYVSPDPLKGVIWRLEDYLKLFDFSKDGQIIGEASPSYLYTYQTTIKNIKKVYGKRYKDLKIIIILRNPVDRAWSQYMHFKRDLIEPLDFEEAIKPEVIRWRLENNWSIFYDYIGFGMYYEQINAYINNFPQVKIFLYDDLKNKTEQLLKEVFIFLNVDKDFIPSNIKKIYNQSGIIRWQALSPIYKIIIDNKSLLKRSVKLILPRKIRVNLKEMIIYKIFLKKKTLPPDIREKLSDIYKEEMLKLKEMGVYL